MCVNEQEWGFRSTHTCSPFLPNCSSCLLQFKPYMEAQSPQNTAGLCAQFRRKPKASFQLGHFILIGCLRVQAPVRQQELLAIIPKL